jgi:hypothetical protein
MGSSILDYFNGSYSPTADQSNEAAKWSEHLFNQDLQANGGWMGPSSTQGIDAGPSTPAAARVLAEQQSQQAGTRPSIWNMSNLDTPQAGIKAPTYSADGLTQLQNGVVGYNGNDAALKATLGAAGAGEFSYGSTAFGAKSYNDLKNLAQQVGFDSSPYSTTDSLRLGLDNQLKDYFSIAGLSQGWNDQGNARGANKTLYKRVNGQLIPLQTGEYNVREKGNWIQEHPGILAPLGVAAGGLAAMYGGAGAGASGSAAGGSGGASTGAAAAGSAGAGTSGLSGSVANALGLGSQWGALPAWGQGAIQGAGMGGLNSGLRGGNILEGALMGGLTGGVGGGLSSGLQGMGMNSSLAGGLGRMGGNMLGGAIQGQDLGSMFSGGLMNLGLQQAGGALGLNANFGGPGLQGILARLAAQQGGSFLGRQIDPRLAGVGGMAGQGLASLFYR